MYIRCICMLSYAYSYVYASLYVVYETSVHLTRALYDIMCMSKC